MNKLIPFLSFSSSHGWIVSIFLLLLGINPIRNIKAQTPALYNYTVENGLPSSECYFALQDKKGDIWIATDRGISRYNGYEFKNYTSEDGLTDNTVFTMHEDGKGRIWFLGYSGLLCYYWKDSIHKYMYNDLIEKKYKGNRIIRSFYVDEKDNITISYMKHGILQIDKFGNIKEPIEFNEIEKGSTYFSAKINNRWFIGSKINKLKIQDALKRFVYSPKTGVSKEIEIPFTQGINNIISLNRKNNTTVFAISKLAIEITNEEHSQPQILENEIISLAEDDDSCLWVGVYKKGLRRYRANASILESKYDLFLPETSVSSVIQDNEKGFWITTLEDGLYYMPNPNVTTSIVNEKKNHNVITSICSDLQYKLFFGTSKGEIYEINALEDQGASIKIQKKTSEPGYIHQLMFEPYAKELYSASNKYLSLFDVNNQTIHLRQTQTRAIAKTSNGKIIAVSSGVVYNISSNNISDTIAITNNSYRFDAIHIDKEDKIWLASTDGLYFIEGNRIKKDTSSLLQTRVIDIKSLADNRLVIGTIGKGIIVKDDKKVFQLKENDGLISNIINGLYINSNTIYLASNKGIGIVNVEGDRYSIRNFNQEHGLPTNEIKNIYFLNNKIWAGTNNGLISFNPKTIDRNYKEPKLYIEKIKVNGIEIPISKTVFNHDENYFEIEFNGYNYRKRGKLNFEYRLVGLHQQWSSTFGRKITFTSLDPGTYRFEIKTCNEDGVWNLHPISYTFRIDLPYWKRPAFIFLSIMFILSITSGFIWWRIYLIKQKNQLMIQMNEFQRKALAAQINPHFIFNSLNSINSFIINEDRLNASKYLNRFAKLMRLCLNNSEKKYVPVNEEYDLINTYLELEAMRFRNKFTFNISIEDEIVSGNYKIPSMLLQPYIENSIIHGVIPREDQNGKISIRLFMIKEQMCCEIIDNGIGRVRAQELNRSTVTKYKSMGTLLTEERMKAYADNIEFKYYFEIVDLYNEKQEAIGTKITFNLPYIF